MTAAAAAAAADHELYKLVIIGGGPAGIGVFIRAARTGFLPRLLNPQLHGTHKDLELSERCGFKQKGVAILHDGNASTFGSGSLGNYQINSNTFAKSLLSSVLDEKPELDPPESIKNTFLEHAREHESTQRLEQIGLATACLVEMGNFLKYVGGCALKELELHSETSKCLLNSGVCYCDSCPNTLSSIFCSGYNYRHDRLRGNRPRDAEGLQLRLGLLQYAVFTKSGIEEGAIMGEYAGVLPNYDYSKDANQSSEYNIAIDIRSSRKEKLYIEARERESISRILNHSCDPNCQFFKVQNRRRVPVVVAAIQDIHQGTELTVDYGDQIWCSCHYGSQLCHG